MKFRTEITPLAGLTGAISHDSVVWTIGSCFADNIGDRMLAEGFRVEVNPLGTLYNPLSILRSVAAVVEGKVYDEGDFFEYEGLWRCYDIHSLFAKRTVGESVAMVNSTLERLRSQLPKLTTVILTFGSARCFRRIDTGAVVANCHKQPARLFRVEDLTVDVSREAISETISLLQRVAPNLRNIILTVSPIRHISYGLHTDRLSKSTLLLAASALCTPTDATAAKTDVTTGNAAKAAPEVTYFPAYEIMMDDLRDYRFYAADMVHPSEVAVDYIYSIFTSSFYSPATIAEAAAHLKDFRRSLHRPR